MQVERYASGVNLHEPEEEAWITKLAKGLPPGRAVFVDIGAAIGYYCFLVAKARPDAELHAYEPDTDNHARLIIIVVTDFHFCASKKTISQTAFSYPMKRVKSNEKLHRRTVAPTTRAPFARVRILIWA